MRFFLFCVSKMRLTRFHLIKAVKENSQWALKAMPNSAYKTYDILMIGKRVGICVCIASEGAYCKDDKKNIDEDLKSFV